MFELLGARVYGSRTREGLYHDGSDVDVVLSYTGNIREDDFFHVLHEDGMEIAGLPLDINPISAEKTCSLEEYMETAEKYLDEKAAVQAEEKSTEIQPEPTITFYVAECSEYPILGEYHERLTLQEAAELYQKIPSDRINGLKEIGFRLEDGSIYDGNFGLMTAGKMQTEFINEIPQYRDSPLVQKAIADMEGILSAWKEAEQQKEAPEDSRRREDTELSGQAEKAALETGKTVEMTPKTDSSISAGSGRKQSVLKALRERQAKLKEQEQKKQEQKTQNRKKGEQEL